jgi:hypothetical protein
MAQLFANAVLWPLRAAAAAPAVAAAAAASVDAGLALLQSSLFAPGEQLAVCLLAAAFMAAAAAVRARGLPSLDSLPRLALALVLSALAMAVKLPVLIVQVWFALFAPRPGNDDPHYRFSEISLLQAMVMTIDAFALTYAPAALWPRALAGALLATQAIAVTAETGQFLGVLLDRNDDWLRTGRDFSDSIRYALLILTGPLLASLVAYTPFLADCKAFPAALPGALRALPGWLAQLAVLPAAAAAAPAQPLLQPPRPRP